MNGAENLVLAYVIPAIVAVWLFGITTRNFLTTFGSLYAMAILLLASFLLVNAQVLPNGEYRGDAAFGVIVLMPYRLFVIIAAWISINTAIRWRQEDELAEVGVLYFKSRTSLWWSLRQFRRVNLGWDTIIKAIMANGGHPIDRADLEVWLNITVRYSFPEAPEELVSKTVQQLIPLITNPTPPRKQRETLVMA